VAKRLKIDPKKGLPPEQFERPYENTVVITAALQAKKDYSLITEQADFEEEVLQLIEKYSLSACVLGLLQALTILVGNIEHEARKRKLELVQGGASR